MNNLSVKKVSVPRYPVLKPLIIGVLSNIIIWFAVVCLSAFLMTLKDVSDTVVMIMIFISAVAGAFFGGFLSSVSYGKKGMLLGIVCGILSFFVIVLAGTIFGGTPLSFVKIIVLLIEIIFSAIGGIAGVNKKFKRKF